MRTNPLNLPHMKADTKTKLAMEFSDTPSVGEGVGAAMPKVSGAGMSDIRAGGQNYDTEMGLSYGPKLRLMKLKNRRSGQDNED